VSNPGDDTMRRQLPSMTLISLLLCVVVQSSMAVVAQPFTDPVGDLLDMQGKPATANAQTRVNASALSSGENNVYAAITDGDGAFGHFATRTSAGRIVKVDMLATTQGATMTKTEDVTAQTTTKTKIISGLDRSMGVEVNPNIELLSIVLSMTSWGRQFPPVRVLLGYKYQDEIEQWFSKFKNHPAVTIAQQLTDAGFNGYAPVDFILHFGPPPKMERLCPYDDYLVGRARGASILDSFADALRGFAEASRFMDFYDSHADLYNSILSTYQELDMRTLVYTLERFWGDEKRGYQIIVGASMSPGRGYGLSVQTDKGDICYCVCGASSPLYSTASLYSLGLHEFSHSFVNPMVAQYKQEVNRLTYLLDPVSRQMSDMRYDSFETMLDETIIRAFESLRSTIEFGPSTGTSRLVSEMRRGFYFVDIVYNHLVEYLYNIDNYSTFVSYLPKILAEISKITPQEAQKRASESLSSPSPSLKSAPTLAVTISFVITSTFLAVDDSSSVRLEMRNTGAIDIYARTVVSITQNLGLLNETVYGIILRRNETQSLNLAIKGIGPIGVASLGARVFYSSRLLDDKTCRIEIIDSRAMTFPGVPLPIIIGVLVILALGLVIVLRKCGRAAVTQKNSTMTYIVYLSAPMLLISMLLPWHLRNRRKKQSRKKNKSPIPI